MRREAREDHFVQLGCQRAAKRFACYLKAATPVREPDGFLGIPLDNGRS